MRERLVREKETAAKFAEEVASSVITTGRQRKEETSQAGMAANAARARRARAAFEKAIRK